jgi:hypothetical protein
MAEQLMSTLSLATISVTTPLAPVSPALAIFALNRAQPPNLADHRRAIFSRTGNQRLWTGNVADLRSATNIRRDRMSCGLKLKSEGRPLSIESSYRGRPKAIGTIRLLSTS